MPISRIYIRIGSEVLPFKSSRFALDILSFLPFELIFNQFNIALTYSHMKSLLRLNRLLKTYRLSEFLSITESKTKFPTVFRLTGLMIKILITMHWNACFYFIISSFVGFGNDGWVFPALTEPDANLTEYERNNVLQTHELDVQYIYCFWWSVLTLTTIGEVQQPTEYYQQFYMSFLLMIGVVILAITIGEIRILFFSAQIFGMIFLSLGALCSHC